MQGEEGTAGCSAGPGHILWHRVHESHSDLGRRDGSTKKNNLFLFRLTDP